MNIKNKFQINNLEISCKPCTIGDRLFILNLLKKTIFKYVAAYHVPSIGMFNDRFYADYQERHILFRKSRKIGLFQLTQGEDKLILTGLFLSPAYQGKGIAKYLMNYFEQIAKENKYHQIELQVRNNNPAQYFYKKLGYKIASKTKYKYIMNKKL